MRVFWRRPSADLALVAGLVYLNQALFTVYVLREHGGDVSFVASYLPSGWFALADGPAMRAFASHVPAPGLLAPSVLRVQAFLELPFVLLAYGVVLRRLSVRWYRRMLDGPPLWAASATYTTVFCLVEQHFSNPYTDADIAIRIASAVITPLWIGWTTRHDPAAERPLGVVGLVAFGAFTWALGQLVLTVYDTALLYNLGHLPGRLPSALVASAVLVGARVVADRYGERGEPGVAVRTVTAGLRWALVLFFVPALAVRYGVNLGLALPSAAAGLAVCVAAALLAVREALRGQNRVRVAGWCGQMARAAGVGGVAGLVARHAASDAYYEAALLRSAAVAFLAAVLVCAGTDRPCAGTDRLSRPADAARRRS
ncbi:hypothetical protein DZF91_29620 [Actinomadura logoneensis]|uniref:Uncharacterized protein n=1 Tax=Actinomadura logoneensis TaxID=2293572 RepID=A0A372JDG7_9ACTN|nr:hypothetical protein [Actinomadura logoneensis]RFU38063.1 hypothetical protein DZF91_29620 [Actinomadura logoneensis]